VPVSRANVLNPATRRQLCPELDEEWYETKVRALPKLGAGHPNREKRAVALCAEDPAEFIFGACRTFDPHDRANPYKKFPDLPDLREALTFIHQPATIACIAKSRQLMMSWLLCAYAVWEARFNPARVIMMQSKKEADAWALVFTDWMTSRCAFIEYSLPPLLWSQFHGRYVQGMQGKLLYPHGSMVWGIPGGPDHFRSHVASLAFIDEAAFHEKFDLTYQAALAMTKGGGRLRIVSTAKYGTYFGTLIEAVEHQQAA
jgi:hypothetical protein